MSDEGPEVGGPALLAVLRGRAGLSQTQLAERAEASRSMLAQVELGERRPSRKLLARVSRALGLAREDEDHLVVAFGFTAARGAPDQIAAFLRADKRLQPEQAERLAELIRRAYQRELER